MFKAAWQSQQKHMIEHIPYRALIQFFTGVRAGGCPFASSTEAMLPLPAPEVMPRDYNPWKPGPYRIVMGLRPIHPSTWFEIGHDYDMYMDERARLMREHHDICVGSTAEVLPSSFSANAGLSLSIFAFVGCMATCICPVIRSQMSLCNVDWQQKSTQLSSEESACCFKPGGFLAAASCCVQHLAATVAGASNMCHVSICMWAASDTCKLFAQHSLQQMTGRGLTSLPMKVRTGIPRGQLANK